MRNKIINSKRNDFEILCGFLFVSIFICAIYFSSKMGSENNILIYGAVVCICILISFFLFEILCKKNIPPRMVTSIKLLSMILILLWLGKGYFYEITTSTQRASNDIRHNISWFWYLLVLIICATVLAQLISKEMMHNAHIVFWGCILLLIIVFFVSYQPAVFNDQFGTIYHVHAYTNSIVNVLRGEPFSESFFSIYGHYGIIYLFPINLLKIFGISELNAIMLTIASVMTVQYAMFFYIVRKRVKNDVIFLITIIAALNPILQMLRGGAYYQIWPHRIFPMTLLLFMLTIERKSYKFRLRNWVIVAGAIIWNVETGIVCGGVLIVYDILENVFMENAFKIRRLLIEILLGILELLGSFFVALLIVNIYNILNGGGWNGIRQFIYPIGNSEYNVAGLSLPLPKVFGWGWGVILVMLLYLVVGVIKVTMCKIIDEEIIFSIIISLAGLGKIVYYVNRTADTNLSIVYYELIILLAMFIERYWTPQISIGCGNIIEFVNLNYEKAVSFLCMIVLSAFAIGSIIYLGINLQININYGKNTEEMDKLCLEIEQIDDNMIAFGQGVPELFAAIDRPTNFYIGDWSDINATMGMLVDKTIMEQEYFFADRNSVLYLTNAWAFDLIETFRLKGYGYGGPQEYTFGIYKNRYWQKSDSINP